MYFLAIFLPSAPQTIFGLQYHKTIEAVYLVENFVETLLDLLQRYREKAGDKVAEKGGSIFTKACFLLALHLQDEHRAAVCRLLRRLKKIIKLNRKDCYYSCVNVTPFCFLFFFFIRRS